MLLARVFGVVAPALLLSCFGTCQTVPAPTSSAQPAQTDANAPQPLSYANYSLMLVSPILGGGAVALMHNPKNELEFVDVNKAKDAFTAGYVPVRAVELAEFIGSLKEENARLAAENVRLQSEQPKQVASATASSAPSQTELEAQRRAQVESDKSARRR